MLHRGLQFFGSPQEALSLLTEEELAGDDDGRQRNDGREGGGNHVLPKDAVTKLGAFFGGHRSGFLKGGTRTVYEIF